MDWAGRRSGDDMVAPRKRTPQMFMGAPTAPQATNPAGMFGAPLTRQEPKRNFDWASLLQGIGAGLLTGDNISDGLGKGLILAREFGDQRADNERYDRRDQREEERYQYGLNQDQQATQAAAAEKAQRDAAIDALPIDPSVKAAMKAGIADYNDAVPKASGPESSQGKLAADLKAGLIDQATYDALLKKDTYIAPSAGSTPTERERNALSAGLTRGTPEWNQYMLGKDDTAPGPFQGTGLDAQSYNMVLTGDPTKPEYAAAYAQLATPKVQFDPVTQKMVVVQPDLSWARKPTGQVAPPANPNLSTTQVPGATVTSDPGTGQSPADRSKMKDIEANAQSIKSALTNYKQTVQSSDLGSDISAYAGGMTEGGRKLNTTYNAAALMTKAEALFNLGVLNGPDLDIIRRTVPDPSTFSGLFTSEAAAGVAVDQVIKLIDERLEAFRSQYGGAKPDDPLGILD